MTQYLTAQSSITIRASITRVWEALTTPRLIKEWFFGVDTETDWIPGCPIVHRGEWQGRPYVDKGEIVAFDPPKRLVHTHWSNLSGLPDQDEHYQWVTYALAERDGVTDLTITAVNLPNSGGMSISEKSWYVVLSNLKQLLEP